MWSRKCSGIFWVVFVPEDALYHMDCCNDAARSSEQRLSPSATQFLSSPVLCRVDSLIRVLQWRSLRSAVSIIISWWRRRWRHSERRTLTLSQTPLTLAVVCTVDPLLSVCVCVSGWVTLVTHASLSCKRHQWEHLALRRQEPFIGDTERREREREHSLQVTHTRSRWWHAASVPGV